MSEFSVWANVLRKAFTCSVQVTTANDTLFGQHERIRNQTIKSCYGDGRYQHRDDRLCIINSKLVFMVNYVLGHEHRTRVFATLRFPNSFPPLTVDLSPRLETPSN